MGQKFAKTQLCTSKVNYFVKRCISFELRMSITESFHVLKFLFTYPMYFFLKLFFKVIHASTPLFLSHALMSICLEKWLITKFLYYPDTWIKYSRKTFIFIMIIHFHFFYLHFVASCTKKSEKVFPHNCCRECRTICLGHPVSSILW